MWQYANGNCNGFNYFYIFTCREPRLSTENGFPFADIAVFFVEVGADFD